RLGPCDYDCGVPVLGVPYRSRSWRPPCWTLIVYYRFSCYNPLAPVLPSPVSSQVEAYTLLNLRAGYRFWQQKAAAGYLREAEVAVSVFNALNDEHKEHPLGDLISRRIMGWLTVRF
ncbi:MAG: hypothetical protein AB7G68_20885, partial [Nitrospiraceae bacterium]